MEAERLTTTDRTLVPNRFVVHLHPADLAEFGDMTGSLASELADGALSFARAHRYTSSIGRASTCWPTRPSSGPTSASTPGSPRRSPAASGHGPVAADRPNGERRHRRRSTRRRHVVYAVPRPTTPRAVLRVTDPDGRTRDGRRRRREPDHRPGDRQRPRRPRRPRVAPPRPDRRPARHAGLRRPRQHERLARQRRAGQRGRARGGDRLEVGDTSLVVEVAGARRLMDGFLLVLWAVRLLFLALIYLFLSRVIRALLRDLRAAAREPADGRAGWSSSSRRAASRPPAIRSASTSSPRSGATSTTRSSSTTRSPRPTTRC